MSRKTRCQSLQLEADTGLAVLCSRSGDLSTLPQGEHGSLHPAVAPATHLSLLSSIRSSASEKFSTWSPLGSGCTEQRTEGGSAPMLLPTSSC